MAADVPVMVARRGNEWFASVPFATLKKTVLESESWDQAAADLERQGYPSIDELIHPDVVLDVTGLPGGGTLPSGRGREVWLAFWREWLEPWEDLEIEHSNYEGRGSHALVDLRVTAQGQLSGVPATLEISQLWTVEEGRVVGYSAFLHREEAIEAMEKAERVRP